MSASASDRPSTSAGGRILAEHEGAGCAFDALEQELASLPVGGLPDFLGALARLEALASLRLNQTPGGQAPVEDRLIDVKEAAGRLGMSGSRLYKTADDFPFTIRTGRTLRFSSLGIDRWISKRAR